MKNAEDKPIKVGEQFCTESMLNKDGIHCDFTGKECLTRYAKCGFRDTKKK